MCRTTSGWSGPSADRDSGVMVAIDQYRYIDSDQVAELFDQSRRKAQLRLKDLLWRGLIYRWPPDLQQGSPLTPTVYALTTSGARHIAKLRDQDPRPICERASRAREQIYHLRHALHANRFFAKLAAAARELPDRGIYNWLSGATS